MDRKSSNGTTGKALLENHNSLVRSIGIKKATNAVILTNFNLSKFKKSNIY